MPGQVQTDQAPLSGCQPIPYDGGIVWYVTNGSAPVFYTLDGSGVGRHEAGTDQQPEKPEDPEPAMPTPAQAERMYAAPTFSSMTALDASGTLWMWGEAASALGYHNQVDVFQNPYQDTPVRTSLTGCLAAGDNWCVKQDHSLWMWGWSGAVTGALEDQELITTPVKVMDGVRYISGTEECHGGPQNGRLPVGLGRQLLRPDRQRRLVRHPG